ncbi:hypothetical protein EVJ58_g7847 [Rhodofomes roseus]|uniref:Uncharacterized protein n=1 Tax=Rhodofomes roseus TaxID=34475 RepID=A0A4Y9Y184_9APHY|nr:hypothetical protein EVJ58_g7847 [Rhodofomes roseus]
MRMHDMVVQPVLWSVPIRTAIALRVKIACHTLSIYGRATHSPAQGTVPPYGPRRDTYTTHAQAPSMPYAWDVYAQERLPLGHGYPLWDPRPDETAGEIEIGDVGYIEDGRFRRLFNPTLPRDDPANCAWGVPKDFRPLEIGNLITEEQRTLGDDILSSRHVTHAEVNAKVEVESAADLALNYSATASSGALLYIPTRTVLERQVTRKSTIMHDYLLKNYKAWHHNLHHQQKLKLSKKDLVFVHDYTKTAKWAVSAFQNTSQEESAKIGGGHGPAQTSFSIDLSMKESQWEDGRTSGWMGRRRRWTSAFSCSTTSTRLAMAL